MVLIALVCLFWAASFVLVLVEHISWGLREWLSFLIPAALTIVIACDHVRINALNKRVSELEQKRAVPEDKDTD